MNAPIHYRLGGYFIASCLWAYKISHSSPISPWQQSIQLTAIQNIIGAIVSIVYAWYKWRKPFWHFEPKRPLIMAAVCNVVGNLATNAASTAHLVEVIQLVITLGLVKIFLKANCQLTAFNMSSVLPIVLGVYLVLKDLQYSTKGIILALVLTTAFSVYNTLLKWDKHDWLEKFVYVSPLSMITALLLWLGQIICTQMLSTQMLSTAPSSVYHSLNFGNVLSSVLSSSFYFLYNLFSFNVLKDSNPVTHAVFTVLSKTLAYIWNADYNYFSWNFSIGITLSLLGTILYLHSIKKISFKSTLVFVLLYVVFLTFYYGKILQAKQESELFYKRDINSSKQISTAWMYDKLIPDKIVANIARLADQNPNETFNVYCGSKQCMETVGKQMRLNLNVKFAIVSELIKIEGASSSLEEWLARHPINKILAGREFETHLQDVTIMGILWKYGGIYISPTLELEKPLNTLFSMNTSASAYVFKPPKGFSLLDLAFFENHHQFLGEVAYLYGSMYPTKKATDTVPFPQGYLKAMWSMATDNVCTVKTSCPIMLGDFPTSAHKLDAKSVLHFGLFSRSILSATSLIEDNRMQEFAEVQFLPFLDTFIDVDNPGSSSGKNISAFLSGLGGGESWKPPSTLDPIMVSVHLQEDRDGSVEKIKYLKEREPIGCTDSATQKLLSERNVSSYLSASLILLLNNSKSTANIRHNDIYFSNLEYTVFELLPADIQKVGIHLEEKKLTSSDSFDRLETTYKLMMKYKSARLVITQCFHCASACASLGTPVIFVADTVDSSLSTGMTSLFHTLDLYNKSWEQAKEWLANFNWTNIPPNPDLALMMKLRATAWNVISKHQSLYNTAKKLGIIPMSSPRILPKDRKLDFHMIFTSPVSTFKWYHWRSVESVFHHHPTSTLIIYSNTLSQDMFNVLTEVGYSLIVRSYDLEALLKGSPIEDYIKKMPSEKKRKNWIKYEVDLLSRLIVYKFGGVYLDTDVYLVRPLHTLRMNGAGWSNRSNTRLSYHFFMFEKENSFVRKRLTERFISDKNLQKVKGAQNRSHSVNKHAMKAYKHTFFYFIDSSNLQKQCFKETSGETFDRNMKLLHTEAYGLHIDIIEDVVAGTKKIKKGTLCSYILNKYCVLCDNTY